MPCVQVRAGGAVLSSPQPSPSPSPSPPRSRSPRYELAEACSPPPLVAVSRQRLADGQVPFPFTLIQLPSPSPSPSPLVAVSRQRLADGQVGLGWLRTSPHDLPRLSLALGDLPRPPATYTQVWVRPLRTPNLRTRGRFGEAAGEPWQPWQTNPRTQGGSARQRASLTLTLTNQLEDSGGWARRRASRPLQGAFRNFDEPS